MSRQSRTYTEISDRAWYESSNLPKTRVGSSTSRTVTTSYPSLKIAKPWLSAECDAKLHDMYNCTCNRKSIIDSQRMSCHKDAYHTATVVYAVMCSVMVTSNREQWTVHRVQWSSQRPVSGWRRTCAEAPHSLQQLQDISSSSSAAT